MRARTWSWAAGETDRDTTRAAFSRRSRVLSHEFLSSGFSRPMQPGQPGIEHMAEALGAAGVGLTRTHRQVGFQKPAALTDQPVGRAAS